MAELALRHRELLEQDGDLFKNRDTLLTLWQEISEYFYPERADFTYQRVLGETFAIDLDTSYPILARRDLGNSFGSMLRPSAKNWFHTKRKGGDDNNKDEAERQWLEMSEKVQRRAMYDMDSGFVRATKEGDHDFATFGQCVISSELATTPQTGQILLHRCWHLRDVAWVEDAFGKINRIHRKWAPGARQLHGMFPATAGPKVEKLAKDHPFKPVNVRHFIVPSHEYEGNWATPYVSVYFDIDHQNLLEEVGIWNQHYIIPRWETVSGSQYAYSPAIVAALPDARLLNAMTYTIQAAGEKAVDPPLIGVAEAIKGGIEAFPGGFTAVDAVYDERLGDVLRPLHMGGEKYLPAGIEMIQDIRGLIAEAMYLNSLALPDAAGPEMTAFEVSKRIEEFIRQALPLFEPMEADYNGALCQQNFQILKRGGAFGPINEMPESLLSADVEFRFESPLRDAMDRIKGQQLLEAKGMAIEMEVVEPLAVKMVDWRKGLRDALHGIGTPADWMVEEEDMDKMADQQEKLAAAAAVAEQVSASAQIAGQIGEAEKVINEAQATEQPVPMPGEVAI